MYVWNGFTVVGKRPGLTTNILSTLEKAEEQLKNDHSESDDCLHIAGGHFNDQSFCGIRLLKFINGFISLLDPSEYHLDDQCLVQLLKGLCLRELGRLIQAETCFNHVISW